MVRQVFVWPKPSELKDQNQHIDPQKGDCYGKSQKDGEEGRR
jgi:hypothetical protein